jgi:excisionase family DNA binding protein
MSELTIDHAVLVIGVSRATIYNWIQAGRLPSTNDGRTIIEAELKRQEEKLAAMREKYHLYDGIPAASQSEG